MSEALIFASTNPQYDNKLFIIELQVQCMKIPSSNLGRTCCLQKWFLKFRTIFEHNMFSPCSAKRRDSDKDLPVPNVICKCSLIKTYTTEDSLLIFLLEKTTFEEYEKTIYFATNRDFVINKILPKYVHFQYKKIPT